MTYIFLDESGDLGFDKNKKSSEYFIITILAIEDKKKLEKIVKKVHRNLRKNTKKLPGGMLHAYKERPITRKRLLTYISTIKPHIMTICLNKKRVYTKMHNEKHILYNYVTNILLDRVFRKKLLSSVRNINLIAAKRETSKFLNENFSSYLTQQARQNHNTHLTVSIQTPTEETGLQAVDFVSWAIFNKYEKKNNEYYDLIKKRIIEENMLFE